MLKNDRLGTKTWRLLSLLACTAAPFAGCSGQEPGDAEPSTVSQSQGIVSQGLVISQVYAGGGNGVDGGTASYAQDFVELFNRSGASISLKGLSIQYGSADKNFGSGTNGIVALPDKNVPAGGYFLVGLDSANDGGGAPALPKLDATGLTGLGASAGKVALASITTALDCGGKTGTSTVPCDPEKIVDLVGYGGSSVSYSEGTPVSGAPGALKSVRRKDAGCTETDSNAGDFELGAPTPRNSETAANICAIDAGPADGGGGTPDDAGPVDAGSADGGGGTPDDAGPADGGGGTPEDAGTDSATPEDGGPADAGTDGAPTDGGTLPLGTGIVISQVYGAGGNANALRNRDYIEVFNKSNVPVSLSGLSLQYGSFDGNFAPPLDSGPNPNNFALPNVTLESGKYYLVAMTKGTNGADVDFDVEGTITMGAANGKVALARTTDSLNCGAASKPCEPAKIVDLVGYGTATFYEGSGPTAPFSAILAGFRKNNGCTDTDNNAGDFTTGAPAPRNNSAPAVVDCGGITPEDGGTGDGGTTADGGKTDAGKSDAGKSDSGTGNPYDSGPPPRNDGGSGNGAIDVDSGCSCSTPGSSTPMDQGLALGTFAALGLVISARRRRAS